MCRILVVALAGALCALCAAPGLALGKEGVRARLLTTVPFAAPPGEAITVAWALDVVDGRRRHPFGAGGVFVRLSSASGQRPSKAHGEGRRGRYTAQVTVPEGGVGGIRFGLKGTRYVGGGPGRGRAEDADLYFPLVNDPLAVAQMHNRRYACIMLSFFACPTCRFATFPMMSIDA